MRTHGRKAVALGCALGLTTVSMTPAMAGFLDKLVDKAKQEVENQAERAVEQKTRQLVECVSTDLECIRAAEARGDEVRVVEAEDEPATGPAAQNAGGGAKPDDGAGQPAGRIVGTIEMRIAGEPRVFEVREGPVAEGFETGFNTSIRGERRVVGATLHGQAPASAEWVELSVGFWLESGTHMCDPFANQLQHYSPTGKHGKRRKLRPDGTGSTTCPKPEGGGFGGLSLNIDLIEASIDSGAETVRVAGRFAGPLGRGDDALQVTDGRFEAELTAYDSL